ncbi:MAG: hypothetical protein M2R45_01566 [Verrucomicrobia subdivision 3 bacterium]|nr:hypothetical protein [Limisphaerales bacterium]MCS1413307.1 hypothetical protein [Limisphaerales bacterium]
MKEPMRLKKVLGSSESQMDAPRHSESTGGLRDSLDGKGSGLTKAVFELDQAVRSEKISGLALSLWQGQRA